MKRAEPYSSVSSIDLKTVIMWNTIYSEYRLKELHIGMDRCPCYPDITEMTIQSTKRHDTWIDGWIDRQTDNWTGRQMENKK